MGEPRFAMQSIQLFSHPLLPTVLAAAVLLLTAPVTSAQVDATAWTNVEGTTIWARLDGIAGGKVILNMRGRTYQVPLCRLAPRSVEKAQQMMKLKEATSADRLPKSSPRNVTAHNPEPHIEIEDIGPPAEYEMPPVPKEAVEQHQAPAYGSDLPQWTEIPDVNEACYAAVLPTRSAVTTRMIKVISGLRSATSVSAPVSAPNVIRAAIGAANHLQDKPYKWGGGHGSIQDTGYDCSGSVSYVLIRAGLLDRPLTSGSFTRYGAAGSGRWITIYARNGHVFMTICGMRLDTGGSGGRGESGPRWRDANRGTSGFVMRHPPGC